MNVFGRLLRPIVSSGPLLLIPLLPALAGALQAADMESWPSLNFAVLESDRFTLEASGGLRIRDKLGEFYDRRVSTLGHYKIGKGISVSAGYMLRYKTFRDVAPADWDHRLSAGINYALLGSGAYELSGSTIYERHVSQPVRDFNRYRQQFSVESGRTGLSPWLFQGLTFLNRGLVRSRSRLGLQWRGRSGFVFAAAYQFESRRVPGLTGWTPRHAVLTSFSFEQPFWKIER